MSAAEATLNINVGVLGHVDSGKTSLVKALSTLLSTASLDKHPQSKQRGITLDLGFSAFVVDAPDHIREAGYDKVQFTLVDCPGHASLIRTIIGGAQIIDLMVLVVDVIKGIQTQTSECIVIGEITTDDMIVALNKVDLLPEDRREAALESVKCSIAKALASTQFNAAPMLPVAAAVGGEKVAAVDAEAGRGPVESAGVDDLVQLLRSRVRVPQRSARGPLYFAVDHCFPIRGQGTVLTGTVLSGCVRVGDTVELPALKVERKVKSMQMFHQPVREAKQGDRVGICVTSLDAKLVERGIAATPGTIPMISAALVLLRRIRFYANAVASGTKFHVTVGHSTVMGTATFFGPPVPLASLAADGAADAADASSAAAAAAAAGAGDDLVDASVGLGGASAHFPKVPFDWSAEYEYQEELSGPGRKATVEGGRGGRGGGRGGRGGGRGGGAAAGRGGAAARGVAQWALLRFEAPTQCPLNSLVIGSKLDADVHTDKCRLAFFGRMMQPLDPSPAVLRQLKVYKWKEREGQVDRVMDERTVVGKGLFKKETDFSAFVGMRVEAEGGAAGRIESAFGKSGKFKVTFDVPTEGVKPHDRLVLRFKRYLWDTDKRMHQ